MAIGTILFTAMITAIGAGTAGIFIRQQEVNQLKTQIKDLQETVKKLSSIITKQNEQIRNITVEYKAVAFIRFSKKKKIKKLLKSKLEVQYSYKDYLEILCLLKDGADLSEEQKLFFSLFDKIINDQELTEGETNAIREYVRSTHKEEIEALVECHSEDVLVRLLTK